CMEEGGSPESCSQPLDPELMPPDRADAADLDELADRGPVHAVDLTDRICPDDECPTLIGNVFVFYDTDHVTATYMDTLGDATTRQLEESGFTWWSGASASLALAWDAMPSALRRQRPTAAWSGASIPWR